MKLQTQAGQGSESKRGAALIMALLAATAAAGMAMLLMTTSRTSSDSANREAARLRARYLAEGALEHAKKEVLNAIANFGLPPTEGATEIDGIAVAYEIEAIPWETVPEGVDLSIPLLEESYFERVVEDPSGIKTTTRRYEMSARVAWRGVFWEAHRIINAESTPLFQFAVFYTDDLEVQPGPDMTLGGRVHSNGDMFLGTGGTLTVDTNYLRSVGDIYRRRKDKPGESNGNVDVRRWVANPYDPTEPVEFVRMNSRSQMEALGVETASGFDGDFVTGHDEEMDGSYFDEGDWLPWSVGALEYWSEPDEYTGGHGSTVQTGEHGLTESVTPRIGSIQMFDPTEGGSYLYDDLLGEYVEVGAGAGTHERGFYHGAADLVVIGAADGDLRIYNGAGEELSLSDFAGAIELGSVYDARQANGSIDSVSVVEIDIEALGDAGLFPENGLVYVSHYGMGAASEAKGVRLRNGEELATALTVVVEGSIYVEGDYNTVAKKGAAVIGDAVSLLSNSWDDTKGAGDLPAASNTTYNVAMITGNHATVGSAYNGGLENLPRFHENWSGRTASIRGSFVNTWESEYATGKWKYGSDRYTAPRRDWHYETSFNDVANLPPFTPVAVAARDVVSW